MSHPDVETFKTVSGDVAAGKITPEEGVERISALNFLAFDIDDIQHVQQAAWLPDDVSVNIMKKWMRQQNQVLLSLRAFLVMTPTISKEQLMDFTRAIKSPSNEPDLTVENIIYQIATAGGTRAPVNPVEQELITCQCKSEVPDHDIAKLFTYKKGDFYWSNSVQGEYIIVSLPPFLKAQVSSYVLGSPPRSEGKKAEGGIMSWQLQGSNDGKNFVSIDLVNNDKGLQTGGVEAKYEIADPAKAGYFSHFKLLNTGLNHQSNLSLYLSKFDISGKLLICKQ